MIDRDERLALATQAAKEAQPRASGWWRAACPFCPIVLGKEVRDQSLSIQVDTGHYHCFRCGTGGSIEPDDDLKARAAAVPRDSDEAHRPPEGFTPLANDKNVLRSLAFRPAFKYLRGRNVFMPTIHALGIGATVVGRYANRIICPVLEGTSWRGFVARDWTGRAEVKYLNPRGSWRTDVVYNLTAAAQETTEPCLLVEGVFDVLPFRNDAAAFLGTWTEEQIAIIKAVARRPLAVVLDGDAWEAGWALAQRFRLDGLRAGAIKLPPRKDPDDVPADWLRARARECLEE